jgi:predicted dehydrogenase
VTDLGGDARRSLCTRTPGSSDVIDAEQVDGYRSAAGWLDGKSSVSNSPEWGTGAGITPPTIAWVGLGEAAEHHLAALDQLDGLAVPLAAYDPDARARARCNDKLQTYSSLDAMLRRERADVLIVALPTGSHARVCRELLDRRAAPTVLVEKPIATSLREVEALYARASECGISVRGIYHAAFAPEVEWGLEVMDDELGRLERIEAEFIDACARLEPRRRAHTYGDSWVNSGINALSVLTRFIDVESVRVQAVPGLISTFTADLIASDRSMPVQSRIFTSWHAAEPAKITRLRFEGDRLLILNHQATAAQLFVATALVSAWGADGTIERLTSHYINALRAALTPNNGAMDDLHLHRLLLQERAQKER